MSNYVIITSAHNEEDFIRLTLDAVVSQTVLPAKWVVVNDASTDHTGEIVEEFAQRFSFIKLVNLQREDGRNFVRQVKAFYRGLAELKDTAFDFIGPLDADMSFAPEYFENILRGFAADPQLGISGGIVYSKFSRDFATYDRTLDCVGGKVQLFRRACFEDIGGYLPLKYGGADAAAEIMARMKGWKVRKSLEHRAFEHRPTGFSYGKPFRAKMEEARRFQSLGYDPIFFLLRCIYRLGNHPFILGSGAALLGFFGSMLRREPFVLPPAVVSYLRAEQRTKIRGLLRFRFNS